ncbi:Dynamin-related protein 4C [Platanthera zijinensis]|uniref:Dynamin-related protein 4C n=1 Tax=Platanthera zijinensis TaxID=2320716 RepID=A0AAP0B027_9ASPA
MSIKIFYWIEPRKNLIVPNHGEPESSSPTIMEPKNLSFQKPSVNAFTTSYNEQIRPLLDAVGRLRQHEVIQEEIKLLPIVFVGGRSVGKSSVIESLVGIKLPGGNDIRTRVPLIVRLQDDPSLPTPRLHLEYKDKKIESSEADITEAIEIATAEIAGPGSGISDTPVTVVVRNNGLPDLTLVDLPGLAAVPVHGQPANIHEQISGIITKYLKPAESIIVNVLPAGVSFPTCESICFSKQADRTGERTLAVVTKVDMSPEGLLEKVTADKVNIGLGYVCVRNRIRSETFEEARASEAELFESHRLLSRIDKSMAGIPVLAQRLMNIQAQRIAKCIPNIVRKINEKLSSHLSELDGMPQNLVSVADTTSAFRQIISRAKETLKKLLIRGEFEDYPNENQMHCTARLFKMLNEYAEDLSADIPSSKAGFLAEEIAILEEYRDIAMPNFLPRTAFLTLLQMKVKGVSGLPHDFVTKVWSYMENVILRILDDATENYPPLQARTKRAAHNLVEKMRRKSHQFVKEFIEMEMTTDYTCNPNYMKTLAELMNGQKAFMEVIHNLSKPPKICIKSVGDVDVSHLRGKHEGLIGPAFDIKMRLISYWKCVVLRLVDVLALHVKYAVKNLVDHELESEVLNVVVEGPRNEIQKMLEEPPSTAAKRARLKKSVQLLKESKEIVGNIIDKINAISLLE